MTNAQNDRLAIIGLGYVGLPLAIEFNKYFSVVGFDINAKRIEELCQGIDTTQEVDPEELQAARQIKFTTDPEALRNCNIYIVTVPTPIDAHKRPNFKPLISASKTVGQCLKANDLVIYESTVYPGATEEVCVPILEAESGLVFQKDFTLGYSPERVNPGDKSHRITNVVKVTAGSTPETAEQVDVLYQHIITAGTHKASSIRVAEAAKVIENIQRDVNIALVNELAMLFNQMGLDTQEVLAAAKTKWNFLPFQPGLVGGHCIGVDPYYLTYKAQAMGYHPEMILAGRRINDGMGVYIAQQVVRQLAQRRINVVDARILVLGLTFKENCPDLRNTRVVDMVKELEQYHAMVEVYDPWVDPEEARREYHIKSVTALQGMYDSIVLAVAHREFQELAGEELGRLLKSEGFIYDLKGIVPLSRQVVRL